MKTRAAFSRCALVVLALCQCTKADVPESTAVSQVLLARPVATLLDSTGVAYSNTIQSAIVTRNEEFAFYDNHAHRVVLFDSKGRHLPDVGVGTFRTREFGVGDVLLSLPGDTLVVFDGDLHKGLYFVHGRSVDHTVTLSAWVGPDVDNTLIGRFANGQWVGLRVSTAEMAFESYTRRVVDTLAIVVSDGNETPHVLINLNPVRFMITGSGGNASLVSLRQGLSPTVGAVCDSGIVVADTSGIRNFDLNGHTLRTLRTPVPRVPLTQSVRDQQVALALHGITASQRAVARQFLDTLIAPVDSAPYGQTRIDNSGRLWFPVATERGYETVAFDTFGKAFGRVRLPDAGGPYLVGRSTLVAFSTNAVTLAPTFKVYQMPVAPLDSRPALGWCGASFRY